MPKNHKFPQIVSYIRKQIQQGIFRPGQKIPSQYQLSKQFLVNKTTANKAVAQLVAEGLLVRKRGAAGTLVTQTDRTGPLIGILTNLGTLSFSSRLLQGAQMGAFRRGYNLAFYQWMDREDDHSFRDYLALSGVKGLLVNLGHPPADLPFPIMHLDQMPANEHSEHAVNFDNFTGGVMMAEHLMSYGHVNIAVLVMSQSRSTLSDRVKGFLHASERAQGKCQVQVYQVGASNRHVPQMLDYLLKKAPRITALACCSDPLAWQALVHLKKREIDVPRDLSITGFGAIEEYRMIKRLTSIEQHPFSFGLHASERLIDVIEGVQTDTVADVLPVDLYDGETVATASV